jgi:diguanylate cyclase (GGDEF)-like protein
LALDATSAADQALVDRALADGFRLLKFPGALEQAFVDAHAAERAVKLSLAMISAAVFYACILIGDAIMTPDDLGFVATLRVGVFGAVALTAVWVLRHLPNPWLHEWGVTLVAGIACCITGALALHGNLPLTYTKIIELLLILSFVGVFARFWPLVGLGLVASVVHAWVFVHAVDTMGTLRLGASLLLLTTVSFSLYASYVREHSDRLSFLLDLRELGLRDALKATNERLDATARTDALTGAATRRAFDEFRAQRWARAQAEGLGLSLLMVDVDHFKAFNDRYGHQDGDRCLQMVVEAMGTCLRRPVDLLARWGGEEFAVLITDADNTAARQVAQRICEAVEGRGLAHAGSSCAQVVTVSVGLASVRPDAMHPASTAQDLIRQADEALYRAKTSGRNQVCACGDEARAPAIAVPQPQGAVA